MLSQLRIHLDTKEIDYRKASVMQGVLFDYINADYAQQLHQQSFHPYSQYLVNSGEGVEWCINTLDDEAYENIIEVLMKPSFMECRLRQSDIVISIKQKEVKICTDRELMEEFNNVRGTRVMEFEVLTPMAFKQNGVYHILPDTRLIYQNLMNRYSAASRHVDMADEDTLQQLVSETMITRHRIRSSYFPMEKVTIPGFTGTVTFRINGTDTMARYARLLFRFGEYSGIGIKTSMGMGAMRRIDKGDKKYE